MTRGVIPFQSMSNLVLTNGDDPLNDHIIDRHALILHRRDPTDRR